MRDTERVRANKLPGFEAFGMNSQVLASLIFVAGLVVTGAVAHLIALHDPTATDLVRKLHPPCAEFPFGTDHLGRCIFSRVVYGTRISLQIALTVVAVCAAFGTMVGLISGYFGGLTDSLLMRAVDVMLAFPAIVLALAIVAALGPGMVNLMLALILVHWTGYARLVRGEVLAIKEKTFVESAQALGNSRSRIILKHILPNAAGPVLVLATMDVAHVILAGAGLSFLGLGAQPPAPEWGAMVNEGKEFIRSAPYLTVFPGLAIFLTVLAFNLLGDGLRDALDPHADEGCFGLH